MAAGLELARRGHRVLDAGGGERLVDDLNDLLLGHAVLVAEPGVAVKAAAWSTRVVRCRSAAGRRATTERGVDSGGVGG
jgi:hypothetical protein